MPSKIKFFLIGMLVLLIMVGVLSLADQNFVESNIVPTEIIPDNISGPLEPTETPDPKEKDIKPLPNTP